MAKSGRPKHTKQGAAEQSSVVHDAHSLRMREWAEHFQQDPIGVGPRAVMRCRDLAGDLRDMLKLGVESEDAGVRWNEARLELNHLVTLSKVDEISQWVNRGELSGEAAEALIEANDVLQSVLGYPGRIDPGKRQLAEPLERFLQLTREKKRRGGKPCPHCPGGHGYVQNTRSKGRNTKVRYYKCEQCGQNWPIKSPTNV